MRQGEEDAHPAAGEYARPHYAQNKGRAGVVAEGKEALSLGLGAHPLLVEAQGRPGPYGVAAHKAQDKGGGAGPRDVEERTHESLQRAADVTGQTKIHH